MTAHELLTACDRAFLLVTRDAADLVVEVLFPKEHPVPPELPPLLKQHKPEVLALLTYQEKADELLLESTRRLAAAWPHGCVLAGPRWEAHEAAVTVAYWSEDLGALRIVLADRESFAREAFAAHRNEVTP